MAVVDVEASFPAHGEPAELVQQGECLLEDVAQLAERLTAVGLVCQQAGEAAAASSTLTGPAEASSNSRTVRDFLDFGDLVMTHPRMS